MMDLRLVDICDGRATYKVDGMKRQVPIPKGTRDVSSYLRSLEGVADPKPSPISRKKSKKKHD